MLHAFGNTRMKLFAGAILMSLGSVAAAQSVTLTGGGATLPAVGYVLDVSTRYVGAPTDGSFLAAVQSTYGFASSYCQTGSGDGKRILSNNTTGFNVNAQCIPAGSTPSIGFADPSAATPSLTQANFIGSDAPYAVSEWNTYAGGHANSQPVQIPAVSGAIAIVFNKAGVDSMQLSENQVCRIFSAQLTTWDQLRAEGALPGNTTASGPIRIAYRSDGSGTSFAFLNHLSAKCGATGNNSATHFVTDQAYAAVGAPMYVSAYVNALPSSGNPGVVTSVAGNDGAIGYAEAANGVFGGVQFAGVQNDNEVGTFTDPSTFGSSPLPVSVNLDTIITGVDINGRPLTNTLTSQGLTHANGCFALVAPNSYAIPSTGYPIVAVSYLIGNAANNGSTKPQVRQLLAAAYDPAVRAATQTIGNADLPTGLGFLTLSGADASTMANSCIN